MRCTEQHVVNNVISQADWTGGNTRFGNTACLCVRAFWGEGARGDADDSGRAADKQDSTSWVSKYKFMHSSVGTLLPELCRS